MIYFQNFKILPNIIYQKLFKPETIKLKISVLKISVLKTLLTWMIIWKWEIKKLFPKPVERIRPNLVLIRKRL